MGHSKIDEATVRKVASLARLSLHDDEVQALASHFSAVLGHFQAIAEVPTQGVDPLVTSSHIVPHLRADTVTADTPPSQLLQGAPAKSGHLYKVPPVVQQ